MVEEVENPRSSYGQLVHPIVKIVGQGLGKLAVQEPTFLCLRGRGFTRLRLSEFVQISEFFQFYITDIVRHLSHFPKVSI